MSLNWILQSENFQRVFGGFLCYSDSKIRTVYDT